MAEIYQNVVASLVSVSPCVFGCPQLPCVSLISFHRYLEPSMFPCLCQFVVVVTHSIPEPIICKDGELSSLKYKVFYLPSAFGSPSKKITKRTDQVDPGELHRTEEGMVQHQENDKVFKGSFGNRYSSQSSLEVIWSKRWSFGHFTGFQAFFLPKVRNTLCDYGHPRPSVSSGKESCLKMMSETSMWTVCKWTCQFVKITYCCYCSPIYSMIHYTCKTYKPEFFDFDTFTTQPNWPRIGKNCCTISNHFQLWMTQDSDAIIMLLIQSM